MLLHGWPQFCRVCYLLLINKPSSWIFGAGRVRRHRMCPQYLLGFVQRGERRVFGTTGLAEIVLRSLGLFTCMASKVCLCFGVPVLWPKH